MVYIECFYPDGRQILGNGEGQGQIKAAHWTKTKQYQAIRLRILGNHRPGMFARIVSPEGEILEEIRPLKRWRLVWSPEGKTIQPEVFASCAEFAKRNTPYPYSERLGEVYAEELA